MEIGKKIRALRKTKKMTLEELSSKSGVAVATLSRMENQKMTGTLESHINIAKALGIPLTELYSDVGLEKKTIALLSGKSHSEVFVHSDKSSYEMLTPKILDKKMMPILVKIEPEGQTPKEETAPGTEKFIYVLEGEIELNIGKDEYTVDIGDTLYFDASLPHYFKNIGKTQSRIICVTTPPAL